MAYEIVYTSSKAGLAAGSKGFCIVGATNGIPPATLKTLESLSGYRHLHPPAGGPHPSNPTVFSHLILPTGESILSRKCDAGLDYSGRSNNLSHHFVVTSTEQLAAGPARTMAFPGMMLQQWEGDSRALASRNVQSASELSGPCTAWQRATGDAGWAGELANTANNGNKSEAYIVFDEGIDCFPLIDEALSLLPPQDRWQVTFSTFLTALPPNMKCQWRCVMKGSKEYQSMPPHGHILKLDLTKPLGKAPDSALATAARTGNRISIAVKAPTPAIVPAKPPTPSVNRPLPMAKPEVAETAGGDLHVLSSPPVVVQAGPSYMPIGFPEPVFTPPYNFKQKKASKLPIVMAVIICGLLGLILGGAGVFVLGRFSSNALGQLESEQLTLLEDKLVQQDKENKTLSDGNKEINAELNGVKKENEGLKDTLAKTKKEYTELKGDFDAKVAEIEGLNGKLLDSEKSKTALELELSDVKRKMDSNTTTENPASDRKSSGQQGSKELPTIVLGQIETLQKTEFDSISSIQLIDSEANATELYFDPDGKWYGIKPKDDGLVSTPRKFFTLAIDNGKSTLKRGNDWRPPHSDKLMYVQGSSGERSYLFGNANTIEWDIKNDKKQKLSIEILQPASIDIQVLKQGDVVWQKKPLQDPFKQTWYVEAKGEKISNATTNPPAPAYYKTSMFELELSWTPGKFNWKIDIKEPTKPEEQVKDLMSIEDLASRFKGTDISFDLLFQDVALKWDKERRVNVTTEVKIKSKK